MINAKHGFLARLFLMGIAIYAHKKAKIAGSDDVLLLKHLAVFLIIVLNMFLFLNGIWETFIPPLSLALIISIYSPDPSRYPRFAKIWSGVVPIISAILTACGILLFILLLLTFLLAGV